MSITYRVVGVIFGIPTNAETMSLGLRLFMRPWLSDCGAGGSSQGSMS